jgi:isopenicillin-N synthase
MSYVTDNYYPAPVHRVKWVNAERQSLPFFVNLGFDDTIAPWDAAGSGKTPAQEAISYGQYLQNGLLGLIQKNGQT